ncbi:acyl-CoA/acyl-ACP dehydrogenase [Aurantimonas sp. MSK8Z-1]|uniref:acyl-CoA dehydrogenase family protein n=1 Tax=Mangrovibrevibacter kandeliae TaxID=2968473 RepID=UPI0021174EDC|nr:acyl-CoA dehydrogenase family protein [Aurantimonas sp. MSK8Z-1]MCW4115762.1 acyl-CoA/acyl-ACP dehydrogenase [Aurantimonas sp. MSK8Z-1]
MPRDAAPSPGALVEDTLAEVTAAAALGSVDNDAGASFPHAAMEALGELGLIQAPPLGDMRRLLRVLSAVGRGDLSTGRILEGHVNALWLVRRFGSPSQVEAVEAILAAGGSLGIWNTDIPDRPLRLEDGRLVGGKSFATGIDGLSHAIVTVPTNDGRQMLLMPLSGLPVDRSWWRPLGMRASGSHVVDFSGLPVEPAMRLGAPDDYVGQPWFSGGAIRFAAVQTGGAHAVLDAVLAHLRRTGRAGDPYQRHRLGRMGIAVQSCRLWLDHAAEAWRAAEDEPEAGPVADRLVAVANATRCAVEAAALDVLEIAERSVGAAGFIAPHPLERLIRDLRTYLRQPNPDGALAGAGAALAAGDWLPGGGAP